MRRLIGAYIVCNGLSVQILRVITLNGAFLFLSLCLNFTTDWAYLADCNLMILYLFCQKTGFDISCKETICMQIQQKQRVETLGDPWVVNTTGILEQKKTISVF